MIKTTAGQAEQDALAAANTAMLHAYMDQLEALQACQMARDTFDPDAKADWFTGWDEAMEKAHQVACVAENAYDAARIAWEAAVYALIAALEVAVR
jgi:hypothetical protein